MAYAIYDSAATPEVGIGNLLSMTSELMLMPLVFVIHLCFQRLRDHRASSFPWVSGNRMKTVAYAAWMTSMTD
jgi:hypothetical protein